MVGGGVLSGDGGGGGGGEGLPFELQPPATRKAPFMKQLPTRNTLPLIWCVLVGVFPRHTTVNTLVEY